MFKKYYFLLSLCSAWMIGIGFRMMMESFTKGDVLIKISGFELWFDWIIMFLLGIGLLLFLGWDYIKNDKKVVQDG